MIVVQFPEAVVGAITRLSSWIIDGTQRDPHMSISTYSVCARLDCRISIPHVTYHAGYIKQIEMYPNRGIQPPFR